MVGTGAQSPGFADSSPRVLAGSSHIVTVPASDSVADEAPAGAAARPSMTSMPNAIVVLFNILFSPLIVHFGKTNLALGVFEGSV